MRIHKNLHRFKPVLGLSLHNSSIIIASKGQNLVVITLPFVCDYDTIALVEQFESTRIKANCELAFHM